MTPPRACPVLLFLIFLLGTSPSIVAASAPGPPAYGIWHGHPPFRFSAPTALSPEAPYIFAFLMFTDNPTIFIPDPHLTLPSDFNDSREMTASRSNTASLDMKAPYEPFGSQDTRVVCWVVKDFEHEKLEQLKSLDWGWHDIPGNLSDGNAPDCNRQLQGLDLLRDGLVDLQSGMLAEYKGRGGNASDQDDTRNTMSGGLPAEDGVADVAQILSAFFERAIDVPQQDAESTTPTGSLSSEVDIFIFGSRWLNGTGPGVENIRVNQGDPRGEIKEMNAVGQDGGIFIRYRGKEDEQVSTNNDSHVVNGGRLGARERWEAFFMAFAGQKATTHPCSGDPLPGSQSFGELIGSS